MPPQFDVLDVFSEERPRLIAFVKRQFPVLCESEAEDATSAVVVDVLRRRPRFDAALKRDGRPGLQRLLRTCAWRQARQCWRRASRNREIPCATYPLTAGHPALQDRLTQLSVDHAGALEWACARAGARDVSALKEAVTDVLLLGDTDTAAARRHGTRREYVNRAKHDYRQRMR